MRYQFWDKVSDIYTPGRDASGKSHFTAEEWSDHFCFRDFYPWKTVITAGPINGGAALEFTAMVENYKRRGLEITAGMKDDEILKLINDYEDNPPDANEPSIEERTVAALELIALENMPDYI